MIRGKTVYHCHGKRKGKKIKTHKTRKKALAQHRAIMVSKKRKKRRKRLEIKGA